jgi:hypothetical protein
MNWREDLESPLHGPQKQGTVGTLVVVWKGLWDRGRTAVRGERPLIAKSAMNGAQPYVRTLEPEWATCRKGLI